MAEIFDVLDVVVGGVFGIQNCGGHGAFPFFVCLIVAHDGDNGKRAA
jgi:hypothetical protein